MVEKKVLVVDDESDNTELVAAVLELEGHRVRQAHSGDEACQKLDDESADVVFTDHNMPNGNGFAVIEKCRTLGIPVIMVSDGQGAPGLRARALAAGAKGFLNKPVNARDLIRAVREATTANP